MRSRPAKTWRAHLQRANAELERQVEALKASEERFRTAVDGTKDYAIFMLDSTGRVVSWNLGAERIKKFSTEDIIGQHCSRFYLPEDIAAGKPEDELRIAAAEGRYEDEGWRLRGDGSRFWANVVLTAVRDERGNLRGFSKITRDMTERKQADENARRLVQEQEARFAAQQYAQLIEGQREQLRVTLTSIGDGVITTDALGQVTLLNPVAETLTGWKNENAFGQPLSSVFQIVDQKSRQLLENPVGELLGTGPVPIAASAKVLIATDGRERPIDDSAALIKNEQGETVGVVLVFRDVTEKQAAEMPCGPARSRWRTLTEALPNLVWTDLPDGQCDWLSSQWEKYTGIPENELLGLRG